MPTRSYAPRTPVREQDLDPVQAAGLARVRQETALQAEEAERARASAPLTEISRRIQVAGNIVGLMKNLYDMEREAEVQEGAAAAIAGLREINPAEPEAPTRIMQLEEMNPHGALHPAYQEARKSLLESSKPFQAVYTEARQYGPLENFIRRDPATGGFAGVNHDALNTARAAAAGNRAGAEIKAISGAAPPGSATLFSTGPDGAVRAQVNPSAAQDELNKALAVLSDEEAGEVKARVTKLVEQDWNKLLSGDSSLTPGERYLSSQIRGASQSGNTAELDRLKQQFYSDVERQVVTQASTEKLTGLKNLQTNMRNLQNEINAVATAFRAVPATDFQQQKVLSEKMRVLVDRLSGGDAADPAPGAPAAGSVDKYLPGATTPASNKNRGWERKATDASGFGGGKAAGGRKPE